MNVIEVSNLTKSYGSHFKLEIDQFKLEKGKVFALIGLNGAGKTSFVKLLLDLMNKDSGDVKLNGRVNTDPKSRQSTVFLPEKFTFHLFYTPETVLEFFAQMREIEKGEIKEKVHNALQTLNIFDIKDRSLKTLSKGQMQRVGLASMLLTNNNLLILDEPFSGLDPIGMKDLKKIIKDEKAKGTSIFLNSHILSEMELICDEFAIIHQGKMVCQMPISKIPEQFKNLEDFFAHTIGASHE